MTTVNKISTSKIPTSERTDRIAKVMVWLLFTTNIVGCNDWWQQNNWWQQRSNNFQDTPEKIGKIDKIGETTNKSSRDTFDAREAFAGIEAPDTEKATEMEELRITRLKDLGLKGKDLEDATHYIQNLYLSEEDEKLFLDLFCAMWGSKEWDDAVTRFIQNEKYNKFLASVIILAGTLELNQLEWLDQ